jgi:hypothetical protein
MRNRRTAAALLSLALLGACTAPTEKTTVATTVPAVTTITPATLGVPEAWSGSLHAVGTTGLLQRWDAQLAIKGSMEEAFLAAGKPTMLLDTRVIAAGGTAAAPLVGPIAMRSIGAVFDPDLERAYFAFRAFPADIDLLVFIAATKESSLLPFVY